MSTHVYTLYELAQYLQADPQLQDTEKCLRTLDCFCPIQSYHMYRGYINE